MLKKTTLAAMAALMTVSFAAPAAMADSEGEIKYRKSVMRAVGGHMGGIAGILKGETVNKDNLQIHTEGMLTMSNVVDTVFPEGSDFGDTTVLSKVWDQPGEFDKAVKQFQDAAKVMAAAGRSGDMAEVGAAMKDLGESCKNCHENFREKKEDR